MHKSEQIYIFMLVMVVWITLFSPLIKTMLRLCKWKKKKLHLSWICGSVTFVWIFDICISYRYQVKQWRKHNFLIECQAWRGRIQRQLQWIFGEKKKNYFLALNGESQYFPSISTKKYSGLRLNFLFWSSYFNFVLLRER